MSGRSLYLIPCWFSCVFWDCRKGFCYYYKVCWINHVKSVWVNTLEVYFSLILKKIPNMVMPSYDVMLSPELVIHGSQAKQIPRSSGNVDEVPTCSTWSWRKSMETIGKIKPDDLKPNKNNKTALCNLYAVSY